MRLFFFKLNEKDELLCNGVYKEDGTVDDLKSNWEKVEEFYPIVVEKANNFFGKKFVQNVE